MPASCRKAHKNFCKVVISAGEKSLLNFYNTGARGLVRDVAGRA